MQEYFIRRMWSLPYVHFVNRTPCKLEKYTNCFAGMPDRIDRLIDLKGAQVVGREGKRRRPDTAYDRNQGWRSLSLSHNGFCRGRAMCTRE